MTRQLRLRISSRLQVDGDKARNLSHRWHPSALQLLTAHRVESLIYPTVKMYKIIEDALDTRAMEYVLDTLSELPISQTFTCNLLVLVSSTHVHRNKTEESFAKSVRIGIFVGFGVILLIAALHT